MRLKAYGKLNLILNVLGKRPDGYHEIETVFYRLDLFDEVKICPSFFDKIIMKDKEGKEIPIPLESNLCYKALLCMREKYNKKSSFHIYIRKRIPIAGGLGGGSSDAAAVIYGLSKLWSIDDKKALFEIAEGLGSDVPFCLLTHYGIDAALGKGRGEILKAISLPRFNIELKESNINIENKTASVYKELRKEDYEKPYDIESFLQETELEEKIKFLGNHLQAPLERISKKKMEGYILCGAGPTYFRIKI